MPGPTRRLGATAQNAIILIAMLAVLLFAHSRDYLLFHGLVELSAVAVAWMLFAVVWNGRRQLNSHYLLVVGIGYAFVGFLDLLHTLTYEGMSAGPDGNPNLPTQLWVAARYLETGTLLAAPAFLRRRLRPTVGLLVGAGVTGLLLSSIFVWPVFPTCFIPGRGLTMFKVVSEYVIVGLLAVAAVPLLRRPTGLAPTTRRLLLAGLAVTALSELSFTLYQDPYGTFNAVGHLLKFVSFMLVFRAVVQTAIREPYNLLFRDLKQSEQRYRSYYALGLVGMGVLDPNGRWIEANERLAEIFGRSSDELLAHPWEDLLLHEDLPVDSAERQAVLAGHGDRYSVNVRGRRPDGRVVHVIVSAAGVRAADGTVDHFVLLVQDITEQRETEAASQRLQEQLLNYRRQESLRTMAGGIAHDFNNLLTSILGNAELCTIRLPEGHPARRPLGEILLAAGRASDLTRQVLFASGHAHMTRRETDINALLTELAERPPVNCRVTLHLDPELPVVTIDREQIRQVVTNLLANAAESYGNTSGPIALSSGVDDIAAEELPAVDAGVRLPGGRYVWLRVQDNGCGIESGLQTQIFEPFFSTKFTGRGLGLAAVQGSVRAHHGAIRLESEREAGTTVTVWLPINSNGV